MQDLFFRTSHNALQNVVDGKSNRNADVLFRGKDINFLTREEAIEALHQALERLKMLDGM